MELMTERHALSDLLRRPGITLAALYAEVRQIPGTIDQHLDNLLQMGSGVQTILELGSGMSTVAWLAGGAMVTSVDVDPMPWAADLATLAQGRLAFHQTSSLTFPPRPVDLLFIDTLHIYAQLLAELTLHGPHAASWIVLHDTESFRGPGSPLLDRYHPGDRGLQAALDEWLAQHPEWGVFMHWSHQHGLTVLGRA
jgi:hypothetical protein